MWKVKRMNTARIVVLTIAVGAGGVAACLASGSDIGLGQTAAPEDMRWQTRSAASASNTFIRLNERLDATTRKDGQNAVENSSDDQAPGRGGSVSVVRYGVANSMTIKKWPKGLQI